jgi:hypothetical protein
MNTSFLKNPIVKNILSSVAIAGFGFVLLNITFIFDALFQNLVDGVSKIFIPVDLNMALYWYPPVKHAMFLIIIGLISWFIFKSRLGVLYKAIYMTVPLVVVFVTMGMFLNRSPMAALLLGSLFCIGVLYYFYRSKQSWLYYYTVILVGLVLAIFSLSGGEI